MALRSSTKEKILDVAEGLFAEYGFNDTSLRTITSKAGVNLASVNYHFGDKKTLVRAVLNRYLEAFMPEMKQSLERLNERDDYDMAASRFMLLIGRGYTDVQGHLRWFITNRYNDVLTLFTDSVLKANPNLTRETLFWRLHFTLGTCVFTMASSQALAEIAENDFGSKVDPKSVVDQLIPYLAAGVAAK